MGAPAGCAHLLIMVVANLTQGFLLASPQFIPAYDLGYLTRRFYRKNNRKCV